MCTRHTVHERSCLTSCVARNPIYFEGTDPRNPGVPSSPPVVGTPREQFEAGLTVAEWHGYMDVIGQHNM